MFRFIFIFSVFLITSLAYAGGPTKPGLCCLKNQEELPLSHDSLLVGLWHTSIDWSVLHKKDSKQQCYTPEIRDWVLNNDGSCYDTKGNVCIWGAEKGKVWINFLTTLIYFRGHYDPSAVQTGMDGKIFNDNCNEAAVTSLQADAKQTIPPQEKAPSKKDDYGTSKPRVLDINLMKGKLFYLQWDWACNGKGEWDVIMFYEDGQCSMIIPGSINVSCVWAAADGKIRIDFMDGRHLKGNYNTQSGLITDATTTNLDCETGCSHTTPPPPPPKTPKPIDTLPMPPSSPSESQPPAPPPKPPPPPPFYPTCQQNTSGCT